MNKKKIMSILLCVVIVIFISIAFFEIVPIVKEKDIKTRVFKDMESKSSEPMRAVVGIMPESEKDGLTSHNGIGSGVIFDKKDNTYYVVTAKHVIENQDSKFKIFTKDTKFSGETFNTDENVTFEIPDDKFYESLLDSKIEYISKTDDLAILSFEYDGDLTVLEFETNKLSKNDKLMVIGHPEGNRYKVTYGYVKSNLKTFMNQKVIEHDAYMKQGNSGGVALTENMKIAGINVSGKFTILGHFRAGYMIPFDIVKSNIKTWENQQ